MESDMQIAFKLYGALQELVELKRLKDSQGKTEEYLQRQPLAWAEAGRLVEEYKTPLSVRVITDFDMTHASLNPDGTIGVGGIIKGEK